MEGKYKVRLVTYKQYNEMMGAKGKVFGGLVSTHNTIDNARKSAYEILGRTIPKGSYIVFIYENDVFKGAVHKWFNEKRYWYPSKDGIYASAGKYRLYASGKIGQRLR